MIVLIKDTLVNLDGFRTIEPITNYIRIMFEDRETIDFMFDDEDKVELQMHNLENLLKNY